MRKRWNVMIVPDSPGSKVFSFDLTSSSLRLTIISTLGFILVASVVVAYATFVWQNKKQEKISHLESELKHREAEVSRLREEFSILEQLEDKLRTMAGLKPREQSEEASPEGGPEISEWEVIGGGPSSESASDNKSIDTLTPRELLAHSIELKSSLEEILDVFDREKDRLSCIPSINPVSSQEAWISSGYGYRRDPISGERRFHDGCDIVAPRDTPVIAPADGVVTYAGWREGLGRAIELEHGYGYTTIYGHNHKLFVKKGDHVKRGDLISYVGSSGRSTGPHLHYEVRRNGQLVNPYKYVMQ